jgi:hypothetical protein
MFNLLSPEVEGDPLSVQYQSWISNLIPEYKIEGHEELTNNKTAADIPAIAPYTFRYPDSAIHGLV